MLQLDPPGQWHPKVHPKLLLSSQKWARKNKKKVKIAKNGQKKGDFVRKKTPIRKLFSPFSPTHLLGLSERFVLDPKT